MRKQYEAFPGTLNGMYMSGVMQQSTPAASSIAFAVPVSPSLFYSVSQALLSSLGLDIQAETSSREILDRYAESQTVPSGIPSNLTFHTWDAANGDVSTFLQLRAAEFRAFWGVLSGLLGLSSTEADALYSSGQTVPVAASSVDLGRDIYIGSDYYIVSTCLDPLNLNASQTSVHVDFLGTPIFYYTDIPSSGSISKPVGLSSFIFYLDSSGNVTYTSNVPYYTSGSFISLNEKSAVGVYYIYDTVSGRLFPCYHYSFSDPNVVYLSPNQTALSWQTDLVGSTIVSSAPSGLSIDTPVNNWDTVNDDAGYYINLGTAAGTTADSISDSVISTLSQTGTLTREGTYAESLSDAVGELDTPDRRS